MTAFDDREKAFESAFAHDTELQFKVHSRCAKMLARWAAEQMALPPALADNYVRQVLAHDLKKEGIEDVWELLLADMTQKGLPFTLADIQAKSDLFLKKAKAEIMAE